MKKISKIFGVITLMVVIGLSMTACPEEEEEEQPATIIVTNNSSMAGDIKQEGVTVALYQGESKVKEVTGVQSTKANPAEGTWTVTKSSATFTGIEPGDYQIWVTDAQATPHTYKSKTFTFGEGETKTLSYTGDKVE